MRDSGVFSAGFEIKFFKEDIVSTRGRVSGDSSVLPDPAFAGVLRTAKGLVARMEYRFVAVRAE